MPRPMPATGRVHLVARADVETPLRFADRFFLRVVAIGDRVVPKSESVVVRSLPDFCDQGRETVRALLRRGVPTTYLVDSVDSVSLPTGADLGCRTLTTRSLAGMVAYWRAKVVVHTHGVYGSIPGAGGKRFVNIWHGMPVKLLEGETDVGRNQTDVTVATAPIHADHLARTWNLSTEQVALTGLPRNDVLASPGEKPEWLRAELDGRPLVAWLPTFRTAARHAGRVEGRDLGTATQFSGGDLEAVDALMGELGAHCIIKVHPVAPQPERVDLANVTVLSGRHLDATGTSLYELLAHADVLCTDHSSVWIDFLLTGRPMVFTISDRDQYSSDRGYFFDDLEALLPGPIATTLDELAAPLADALAGGERWSARRAEALGVHHVHTDANSADRVADLVVAQF